MSRLLVSALGSINGFIAVLVILSGIILGNAFIGHGTTGQMAGGILGFLVAAIFCGGLAALILIEKHLRFIADDVRQHQHHEREAAKFKAKATQTAVL